MSKRFTIRSRPFITGVAAAILVALASQSVHAQSLPKRKAGLWEVSMNIAPDKSEDTSRLRADYEKTSPQQLAYVEAQMARMGLALPHIGKDGSVTIRKQVCLTPQEAAEEVRMGSFDKFTKQDSCDGRELSRSATELRYSGVCRAGGDTAKVDLHVYAMTSEGWNMDIKSSTGGKETTVKGTTRWLGADCGSTGKSLLGILGAGRN
jgi:hypothetical protein